ncbi:hypothetical protein ACWEOZ_27620 [Actinoplanes sp. NPDC004185]
MASPIVVGAAPYRSGAQQLQLRVGEAGQATQFGIDVGGPGPGDQVARAAVVMEVGIQDRVTVGSGHRVVIREGGAGGAQHLLGVAGRAHHDHRLVVDAHLVRRKGFEPGGSKDLVRHVTVAAGGEARRTPANLR